MCKASKPWYTHWSQLDTQTHRPYMWGFYTDVCMHICIWFRGAKPDAHIFPYTSRAAVWIYHTSQTLSHHTATSQHHQGCLGSLPYQQGIFIFLIFAFSNPAFGNCERWQFGKVSEHGKKRKRVVASSLNTTSEALFAATVISTSCVPNAHRMRQHQYTVSQPEHLRSKGGGTGQMFVRLSLCA